MYGTLISTQTLASTAASVTFSSIPGTYTDLILVVSARSDYANPTDSLGVRFNNDSAANYTWRLLNGSGSAAASATGSSITYARSGYFNASTSTASTFGNLVANIPNYAGSTAKVLSSDAVQEANTSAAYMDINTSSWTGTAAITSLVLISTNSANFVAGSMFSLYGVLHA